MLLLVHWVPLRGRYKRDSITGGDGLDWSSTPIGQGDDHACLCCPATDGPRRVGLADRVDKAALENRSQLATSIRSWCAWPEILPADVRVRASWPIAASATTSFYRVLTEELEVRLRRIRFRGNIAVTATSGEARAAADWAGAGWSRANTARRGGYRRGVTWSPPWSACKEGGIAGFVVA